MPEHVPSFVPPLPQRIRDVQVAEAISAAAGTDSPPELLELSNVVQAVIPLEPRPPLALSGYYPGTVGIQAAAVALNTSHAGIFGSGFNNVIVRVNWVKVSNFTGGSLTYELRRQDSPFTGFPSVVTVPGYINAGNSANAQVLTVTKTDTVAPVGQFMARIVVADVTTEFIPGPWILNNGILMVICTTVNKPVEFSAGYEAWPAVRQQPPG